MTRKHAWLLWIAAAATPLSLAQNDRDADGNAAAEHEAAADGGFWPTPRMIELIIDRITEDGVKLYNFDEIQLAETRKLLKERIPQWMNEHRAEIMALTNQLLEAQLADEPPAAEDVAKWAQRVMPLVNSFEGEIVAITDVMRSDILNEDQAVVLEGEVAAFRTGIQFATNKMRLWAEGGYDPAIDWHRSPDSRRYRHEEERIAEDEMNRARANAIAYAEGRPEPFPAGAADAAPPAAAGAPPAPPNAAQPAPAARAEPKDEWTTYVDAFIRKYELNADQQSRARTLLKRAQTQREEHLRRNTPKMRELEALFVELKSAASADAAKRLADAEERYRKLYEPIENAFTRLKEKLNDLPTREQHRRVKEREGGNTVAAPAATDVARDGAGKP